MAFAISHNDEVIPFDDILLLIKLMLRSQIKDNMVKLIL